MNLPECSRDHLTMVIALTLVKSASEMMLEVFNKNPSFPIPVGWPFPSMDEFAADVAACQDFYKDTAMHTIIEMVTKKLIEG